MGFRRTALGAVLAAMIVALGACGSSPAAGSDPAGSVTAAYDAVAAGGLAKVTDFVCAAKKNDPTTLLGSGLGALTAAGVDSGTLMGAISVKFTNVKATQTEKTDTTAKVHVTGDATITIDRDKMRAIMKTVLAAQGKPTDDATIDLVMNAMASQMTTTQTMDEDVSLVNEGGKWLIC